MADKENYSPINNAIVIHIGASSVSMLIAETNHEGGHEPVDFLEQPISLGRDVFRDGRISAETTEHIVNIIHGFAAVVAELGLDIKKAARTFVTNILHEASNAERFLNRLQIACSLTISSLDEGEMTRLIYLKTQRRLKDSPPMRQAHAMVLHVGPGNTRILLFEKGNITQYSAYRMGTHRTREAIEGSHNGGTALVRVIRESISSTISQIRYDFRQVEPKAMVVIGYEIQQIANFITDDHGNCSLKSLRRHSTQAAEMSDLDLVQHFRLDYQTAEALVPALEINLAVAEAFNLKQIHLPTSDYEKGLLLDLLGPANSTDSLKKEVIRSARILAKRYRADARHGEGVFRIARQLFEQLQDLHELDEHDALLLQIACLVHEVGNYVSPRQHHKHSEYLILNSEIFGLDQHDLTIVALVSRYHRHSGPRMDHPKYASLPQESRLRISKLAAILRVADALERTHEQRVRSIETERRNQTLLLRIAEVGDVTVERLAMQSKGELFEEVFGLKIIIEDPS